MSKSKSIPKPLSIPGYDFRTALAKICPDYAIDKDNFGQIIIYTDMMEDSNDNYIPWVSEEEEPV